MARELVRALVLAYDTDPQAPPGSEGLITIISWAMWIGFGLCVLGVIIVGARMAISHRQGEQGSHAAALGWIVAGAILVGSAATFVTFFS